MLDRHERITLDAPRGPDAIRLRALVTALTRHGEHTTLAVYDRAGQLRPGRAVVDTTVNLAVADLLAPDLTACPRRHPTTASTTTRTTAATLRIRAGTRGYGC